MCSHKVVSIIILTTAVVLGLAISHPPIHGILLMLYITICIPEELNYIFNMLQHIQRECCMLRMLETWCKVLVTPCDGCVTCHTRHASVTDFRPIWDNTVEVTHMTSSVMYINSHAKGTSLS